MPRTGADDLKGEIFQDQSEVPAGGETQVLGVENRFLVNLRDDGGNSFRREVSGQLDRDQKSVLGGQ